MKRKVAGISPRALDAICNGLAVYIRRRPADGVAYATTFDFSKFVMEEPLEVLRIPFQTTDDLRAFNVDTDPRVQEVLKRYNKDTIRDIL